MPNPFNQANYEDAMRDTLPMPKPATVDPERGQWTSASNAEADSLCHARHRRQLGLADVTSPDADRGTRIHAALAGQPVEPPLSGDEQECADMLAEIEKQVVSSWGGWSETAGCRIVEVRLWCEFYHGLKHSGKPDCVYVLPKDSRALVIDYKTGRGAVTESPRNMQLRDLAVLVARTYGVMEVTVCILQPYAAPLLCQYGIDDLLNALRDLQARVAASNDPDAKATPGEKQCQYCKARLENCPEFAAASLPTTIDGAPVATNEQVGMAIARLDGPKLGQFLGLVRLAADAAEQEVRKRITEGLCVPGWKMGEPGSRETVTDPNTVHQRFCALGGTTEAFLKAVSVTKKTLKASLKEATGAKGKVLDGQFDALLAGCVEEKPTAPKLENSD